MECMISLSPKGNYPHVAMCVYIDVYTYINAYVSTPPPHKCLCEHRKKTPATWVSSGVEVDT